MKIYKIKFKIDEGEIVKFYSTKKFAIKEATRVSKFADNGVAYIFTHEANGIDGEFEYISDSCILITDDRKMVTNGKVTELK